MRPGLPGECSFQVFRVGDDNFFATRFKKSDGRLNLGSHASFGEMGAFGQIFFGFIHRHFVQPLLVRFAEVERDFFDRCTDDKHVRADIAGEQR